MRRFELIPNCSMTVRSASGFYACIATTSAIVAGTFAALGYWPVLPFAGLELLVLGLALRHSMRRGQDRDWIEIRSDDVIVEKKRGNESTRQRFVRHWTSVRLCRGPTQSAPPALLIGAHGKWCSVGEFLTAEERIGVGRRLRNALVAAD